MRKLFLTIFFVLIPMIIFAQNVHKGVVLQTFNNEGYTYMEIQDGNQTKWIACPQFDVAKGDIVETSYGMLMEDFESRTLKRTFKEIYFVTRAKVVSSSKKETKTQPSSKPKGKIYTVKEILSNKEAFADKVVAVKAKVTKFTPSIMRTNWLHVTEAVESSEKIDLVITSQDEAAIGDIIVIEGKVTINKDLGSGYFFPIMIEEAKITKP